MMVISGAGILYQPFVTPLPRAQHHADPQRLEKDVRYFSETLYPRSAAHMNYWHQGISAVMAKVVEGILVLLANGEK